jgi:peptidoglycan/xylan/chitin deacetylase (PgdA/CDA1 family)
MRAAALSWESVQEMAQAGIEFGSHGVTHAVLSNLDQSELRHEIFDSRRLIQQHTGQDVEVIAYPIGKPGSYDERVIRIARECGYRMGVTYESGTNLMTSVDPFRLRRVPVERFVSQRRFEAMLCFPRLFFRSAG